MWAVQAPVGSAGLGSVEGAAGAYRKMQEDAGWLVFARSLVKRTYRMQVVSKP